MPVGRVKVFDDERNFGFVQPMEGGADVYVHVSELDGVETLRPGDVVEYDVEDGEEGPEARSVRVAERAPDDSPAGRVVVGAPPTWDELQELDRQRRDQRRQRRRRR